eukprot:RCo007067
MAQPEFTKVSASLDAILHEQAFQDALKSFVGKHAATFKDLGTDENKHVYYDVYKQYVGMVDDLLTSRLKALLGPSFDLNKFMETLAAKMEDPSTKEFLSTEVFDLLIHLTNFPSFKDMMVAAYKEQTEGAVKLMEKQAPALNPQQADVGFISNMLTGHILPRIPAKIEAGYQKMFKPK